MNQVTVNDIEVAFTDRGNGKVFLMVHGFPLDRSMWDPVAERLEGESRLLAPDLRGYGKTAIGDVDIEQGVSMRRYADDLAGLLDAIGVDEPVVYCGFSMGGYIGWQFLDGYRQRVGGLGLCNTRATADTDEARDMRRRMARHVSEWGAERVAEAMQPKLFATRSLESRTDLVAQTVALISGADPRAIAAAQLGMAVRPDVTPTLPGIDLPAVAVVGEEDQLSTPTEMRAMVEAMPDATLTIVPDAGHMAPVEQPDAVADALRKLL